MKRNICFIVTFLMIFLGANPAMAMRTLTGIEAEGALLMERDTGKVLYEKNGTQRMYPASTTKILTALIALENGDPDDVITISRDVLQVPLDASKAGHVPGELITLKDLISGLLLPSGNDSAYAVAVYFARKKSGNENLGLDESIRFFAEMMNDRAKEIGVQQSNFVNPHGYHDDNHFTTAYDLALIMREALNNPALAEIMGQSGHVVTAEEGKNSKSYNWTNRNLLLSQRHTEYYYPYATGGKTGYTKEAGQCLVSSAIKEGMDLIAVVLNGTEPQRWLDSKAIFDYGFDNFQMHQVVKQGQIVETVMVDKHAPKDTGELEVIAASDYAEILHKGEISKIQQEISWNKELLAIDSENQMLVAPIVEGQELGTATYMLNGAVLTETAVVASRSIEKRTIMDLVFSMEAVPYWAGGILGLFIIFVIGSWISKRKNAKKFRMY